MYVAAYADKRAGRIAAFGSALSVAEGVELAEKLNGPGDAACGDELLQADRASNEHRPTQRARDDPRAAHPARLDDTLAASQTGAHEALSVSCVKHPLACSI